MIFFLFIFSSFSLFVFSFRSVYYNRIINCVIYAKHKTGLSFFILFFLRNDHIFDFFFLHILYIQKGGERGLFWLSLPDFSFRDQLEKLCNVFRNLCFRCVLSQRVALYVQRSWPIFFVIGDRKKIMRSFVKKTFEASKTKTNFEKTAGCVFLSNSKLVCYT